jgi:hypothetical protein
MRVDHGGARFYMSQELRDCADACPVAACAAHGVDMRWNSENAHSAPELLRCDMSTSLR